MKRQAGFSLVEMLISIVVGSVIIAAIYAGVVSGQRSTSDVERKVAAGQDARAALELMAIEIQMASFNPNYVPGIWVVPSGTCNVQSANQNYMGIQAANPFSISIESDLNWNNAVAKSTTPNPNPNEIITYSFDLANQYITRETGCGGAQPFLGDTPSSGRPRAVRVINTTGVPVFRYFNARGVEITGGLPAAIPNIARVDITLWVETENVDVDTGQRRKMVYSTSVIPRNHAIIID